MRIIFTRHPLSLVDYDYISDTSGWSFMEDSAPISNTAPATDPAVSDPSAFSSQGINTGALISAGGQVIGGVGSLMMGYQEAGADEYNAQLELMKGQFEENSLNMQEDETLSTQKAIYAKAGVELSGSPLDVALQTATNYEYDKQVTEFNAQSAANMDNYEAQMAKSKGEFGAASSFISAAGSLLTLV